jgi:hypothetical protein
VSDIQFCDANVLLVVLDPRISYEGLWADSEGDPSAQEHIKRCREDLREHYLSDYAKKLTAPPLRAQPTPTTLKNGSPQKVDFLSRYNKPARANTDELEEYFKLPQENFITCDPVQWWFGRRAQFPNLSRLARDILGIPGMLSYIYVMWTVVKPFALGSAVAVERIFSGGRDTISLRRASLKPDTIRTLMLVKQRLRLARMAT